MRRLSPFSAILIGGTIAGALDITYAIGFSAMHGVPPMRILQSVASGLLGKPAFEGGVPIAILRPRSPFLHRVFVGRDFLSRQQSNSGSHPSCGDCWSVLRFSYLRGDEPRGLAALRLSAKGNLSSARSRDRTPRPHVLYRAAYFAGRASHQVRARLIAANRRTKAAPTLAR